MSQDPPIALWHSVCSTCSITLIECLFLCLCDAAERRRKENKLLPESVLPLNQLRFSRAFLCIIECVCVCVCVCVLSVSSRIQCRCSHSLQPFSLIINVNDFIIGGTYSHHIQLLFPAAEWEVSWYTPVEEGQEEVSSPRHDFFDVLSLSLSISQHSDYLIVTFSVLCDSISSHQWLCSWGWSRCRECRRRQRPDGHRARVQWWRH